MPYLGSHGLESEKIIIIFEICDVKFVQLQTLLQKWKFLSLGPKMPYLGIFGLDCQVYSEPC